MWLVLSSGYLSITVNHYYQLTIMGPQITTTKHQTVLVVSCNVAEVMRLCVHPVAGTVVLQLCTVGATSNGDGWCVMFIGDYSG